MYSHQFKHVKRVLTACYIMLFAVLTGVSRDFVLVIDPGHGGHDCGAVGAKTNEKSINLSVATRLAKAVQERLDHVNVVMTRDDDTFITLQERANIANRSNGDLFISIHVNSVSQKARNRKTIAGAQVYTLGLHKTDAALAVAQRENSVMMLESDYSTTYMGFDPESPELNIVFELSQNKNMEQSVELADAIERNLVKTAGRVDKGVRQAGFWVLWASSMPSVLVELDFISNPDSEKYLMSDSGQEELATAICDAVESYLMSYGPQILGIDTPIKPIRKTPAKTVQSSGTPQDDTGSATAAGTVYRVQLMVADRLYKPGARQFKGLKDVDHYIDGGMYKYTYGEASTLDEAKDIVKSVKDKFKDAFIVEFKDGKRIRIH